MTSAARSGEAGSGRHLNQGEHSLPPWLSCASSPVPIVVPVIDIVIRQTIQGWFIIVYIEIEVLGLPLGLPKRKVQWRSEEFVVPECNHALLATPPAQLLADPCFPSECAAPIGTRNLDTKPYFGRRMKRIAPWLRRGQRLSSIECGRSATAADASPPVGSGDGFQSGLSRKPSAGNLYCREGKSDYRDKMMGCGNSPSVRIKVEYMSVVFYMKNSIRQTFILRCSMTHQA